MVIKWIFSLFWNRNAELNHIGENLNNTTADRKKKYSLNDYNSLGVEWAEIVDSSNIENSKALILYTGGSKETRLVVYEAKKMNVYFPKMHQRNQFNTILLRNQTINNMISLWKKIKMAKSISESIQQHSCQDTLKKGIREKKQKSKKRT